jgi:Tol biopolymer transport system component
VTQAQWQQVKALFQATIQQPESERAAFLAAAVGSDETVRREVESLLEAEQAEGALTDRLPLAGSRRHELAEIDSWQSDASGSPLFQTDGASVAIGPYQIVGPLGAGGMGEVYRARDPRLGREVAIKILPRAFITDPERLARFDREARVLAALNHPHIAAIYGIEQTGAGPALVLEMVDGPTLEQRIREGPLAVDEALSIARQIADALAAAHAKGIVHRDLKPANVKLTAAGLVKVLDFGLAKADGAGAPSALAQSPTITVRSTSDGALFGTAAYMSPEQARGKPADKRSDIWAFGCVLYEMLAGRKAFDRDTISETTAAILESEPDWQAMARSPARVRRVLRRCLEKDVERRLQHIEQARVELSEARPHALDRWLAAPHLDLGRSGRWLALGGIGATAAALVVLPLWPGLGRSGDDPAPLHATFSQATSQSGLEWFPSLSPDGKWIAYGADRGGNRDIYLQSTTGETPFNLTAESAADDDQPAFSPDGERIAFRSGRDGGGIFVMGRTGEAVRRVTRTGFRPTWSPDGRQLAFTTENAELDPQNTLGLSELWVVDVASGATRRLPTLDAVLPSWSPHGHRIAYTTRGARSGSTRLDVWTVNRSGTDPIAVTVDGALNWNPLWAPDGKHLYFVSGRSGPVNLWRVAIDERSGQTSGQPEPITTPSPFVAHLSISADGTRIAYSSIQRSRNIQKLDVDPSTGRPTGEPTWITTGSRLWANPDPSPDGQWLAFYSTVQPEGDLYLTRSDGTGLRQLTSGAESLDRMPRWSPDGRWIAFHSIRGQGQHLWKIRPDGSDRQQLSPLADAIYPVWSPDASRVAVLMAAGLHNPTNDVVIFDPNRPWAEQTPKVIPPPAGGQGEFVVNSWSPDGDRLVGQVGIGARGILTYSLRSATFHRHTDFGGYPVWLPDSRRVMFVSGGKQFFVLDTASSRVDKVFSVERDVIGPPQLSRDGRHAYFTRRVTEGDIWVLTLDAKTASP